MKRPERRGVNSRAGIPEHHLGAKTRTLTHPPDHLASEKPVLNLGVIASAIFELMAGSILVR
jgi:hypothetical protein